MYQQFLFLILVCTNLIANGDRQEDEGPGFQARMKALRMLCQMNPSQALAVRDKCVRDIYF